MAATLALPRPEEINPTLAIGIKLAPENPPAPESLPWLDPSKIAMEISSCAMPGTFAITYDDGPTTNVRELIKKLQQLNVKATFFVNANKNIDDHPVDFTDPTSEAAKTLKEAFDAGHQIGSHTYSHPNLTDLNEEEIFEEMKNNDDAIKRIIGKKPTHMRPPYLSVNDDVLTVLGNLGYKVILMNVDTRDFEHDGDSNEVELIRQEIDEEIDPSNPEEDSFVSLSHDYVSQIVQWTETYVNMIRAKGYRLVTVAECIGDPNPYRA